jgi:hypothetical protein
MSWRPILAVRSKRRLPILGQVSAFSGRQLLGTREAGATWPTLVSLGRCFTSSLGTLCSLYGVRVQSHTERHHNYPPPIHHHTSLKIHLHSCTSFCSLCLCRRRAPLLFCPVHVSPPLRSCSDGSAVSCSRTPSSHMFAALSRCGFLPGASDHCFSTPEE